MAKRRTRRNMNITRGDRKLRRTKKIRRTKKLKRTKKSRRTRKTRRTMKSMMIGGEPITYDQALAIFDQIKGKVHLLNDIFEGDSSETDEMLKKKLLEINRKIADLGMGWADGGQLAHTEGGKKKFIEQISDLKDDFTMIHNSLTGPSLKMIKQWLRNYKGNLSEEYGLDAGEYLTDLMMGDKGVKEHVLAAEKREKEEMERQAQEKEFWQGGLKYL